MSSLHLVLNLKMCLEITIDETNSLQIELRQNAVCFYLQTKQIKYKNIY